MGLRQIGLGLGLMRKRNGSGGAPPERPASTTMLLIADPDAALDLTGANVNGLHEQIELLVDATYNSGTKFTRQTAVLDGFNVLRDAGDYCEYRTPNTADGLYKKWIASDGSNVAAEGCIVVVFKPTSVDDGSAFFSCWNLYNVVAGMLNDGADKFRFSVRDTGGGITEVKVACSLNNWHYAIMRWTTTHIYLSIDGGVETAVAMASTGGVSNMNGRASVFSNSGSGARFRGDFMELSIIDPADIADMEAFLTSNYPELA